jgi:diacylglycerol kinase (ATP)
MIMKGHPFFTRLGFALEGLHQAWKREASFRTQAVIGLVTLAITLYLDPPALWIALVAIMVAMVLSAELINTALEAMIDRLHPEWDPLIKIAKDGFAAAVLVLSFTAVGVFVLMLKTLFLD